MSVYVANTKLYVTSSGAIGISGSPLAFNTGDVVPDGTVTRDGLVAAGLVTSVAGTSPVSVYPVTLVQDPAGALSDGIIPEWDTGTSRWIPGTALSSTAANATYLPLLGAEYVPAVGDYGIFLTDGHAEVIAGTDYVQFHQRLSNSADEPRVWAQNPVIVKDIANAGAVGGATVCYGIEVSVSNNTAEAAAPQTSGDISGIFISYINASNNASAALSIGGLSDGWKNGVWIDGIDPAGVGLTIKDAVGGGGMTIGLDLSNVSGGFSIGALVLGNNNKIVAKTTAAALRSLLYLNASDELQIGDSTTANVLRVRTDITNPSKWAVMTATSASAGTNGAPPAQVLTYWCVEINGVFGRIPVYG